jgi:hypothetical protein
MWEVDSQQASYSRTSENIVPYFDPSYDIYYIAGSEDGTVKIRGDYRYTMMGSELQFRLYGKPQRNGNQLRLIVYCN